MSAMSMRALLDRVNCNTGMRLAILLATLDRLIGLSLSALNAAGLLLWSLLLILFPRFRVWHVPGKYFFRAAPEIHVLVFARAGLRHNTGRVQLDIHLVPGTG